MPAWKGIVGQRFTADEFDAYLKTLDFSAWRPEFVVVHNTQIPRLDEWSGPGEMDIMTRWYRDQQHWSAGPHLFIDDIGIWVFTPLTTPGVHAPSWNAVSLGVEIVGDFSAESFGDEQKALVIRALAALHLTLGWLVPSIRLHKEDPKTTHTGCPGRNVNKAELIAAVGSYLNIPR